MTLKNLLAYGCMGISLLACVPKDKYAGTNASTAPLNNSSNSSANSCSALSGFDTLSECKKTTFAQCYPSDKTIQGATQTCYFAVPGGSACGTNSATWSYGNWSDWCIPSGVPPGTYQHTRRATCTKSVSSCDCVGAAESSEFCAIGNNFYPACDFIDPPTNRCSGTPPPTPTPVVTPTPSLTARWCGNINLNYASTDSAGVDILRDLNNEHYGEISSFFRNHGYGIMYVRAANYSIVSMPRITDSELQNNYTVEITAGKSGCFLGKKTNVHLRLLQGRMNASGYNVIAESAAYSACIHAGDVGGRMLINAMNSLNPPMCY